MEVISQIETQCNYMVWLMAPFGTLMPKICQEMLYLNIQGCGGVAPTKQRYTSSHQALNCVYMLYMWLCVCGLISKDRQAGAASRGATLIVTHPILGYTKTSAQTLTHIMLPAILFICIHAHTNTSCHSCLSAVAAKAVRSSLRR